MDAQTEFAAEIFKTLTQEQKDAILDLVSKMASHEKGLCPSRQAREHRATTNHHRKAGTYSVPPPTNKSKEEIYNGRQETGEREAGGRAPHFGNER